MDRFKELKMKFKKTKLDSSGKKLNKSSNKLYYEIRKHDQLSDEYQRLGRERDKLLEDNPNLQLNMNIAMNADNRRANLFLWLVWIFEAFLSFKGTAYLADHFMGIPSSWWFLILPFGLAFASFAIYGSIIMNHFAQKFKNDNIIKYTFLKIGSYVLIFIIPVCNILEAFESHGGSDGSSFAFILNWLIILITIILHTSIITMSNIFISAKNSKVFSAKLNKQNNLLRKVENKLQNTKTSFDRARDKFVQKAKDFVTKFVELYKQNSEIAQLSLYYLDNFTIWMINNKIYQNKVLPYHTNELGQVVIETDFFDQNLMSYVKTYDQLLTIKNVSNDGHDSKLLSAPKRDIEFVNNNQSSNQIDYISQINDVPLSNGNVNDVNPDNYSKNDDIQMDLFETNKNDKTI